jgi:hypothetical protein
VLTGILVIVADGLLVPSAAGVEATAVWTFRDGWPAFRRVVVTHGSDTVNEYAYEASGGAGCVRGVAGDDGHERVLAVPRGAPRSKDSTITSRWLDRTGGSIGQFGHVHRLVQIGTDRQAAIVIWSDAWFGTPFLLNVNVWRGRDGTFRPHTNPSIEIVDLRKVGIRDYPFVLRTRVVGSTVRIKAWRAGESPPPAWQFTRRLPRVPPGAGRTGVIAPAHVAAGDFMCYGRTVFRALDG